MNRAADLTRRAALVLGCAGLAAAAAPSPARRRLAFDAWREGRHIGRHLVTFGGDDTDFQATIEATMAVSLGPITLFRYHHQAVETWRDGRFAELTSRTVTNGRREQVAAMFTPRGVVVETSVGSHTVPGAAAPLTHWNRGSLDGALFNPQTGASMRERVSRQDGQVLKLADGRSIGASRYVLSGDADITDWYDAQGAWAALRARARDGSYIDYRRATA